MGKWGEIRSLYNCFGQFGHCLVINVKSLLYETSKKTQQNHIKGWGLLPVIRPGEKVSTNMPKQLWYVLRHKICFLCARREIISHSLRKTQQYNGGVSMKNECPWFSWVWFRWVLAPLPDWARAGCSTGAPSRWWVELTEFRRRGAASPSTRRVWVNIKPHYWGVIENLCTSCSI